MNKLSLNKILPKKAFKEGGTSIKLPKGIKVSQIALIFASVLLLALTIFSSASYLQGLNTKDNLTTEIQQKTSTIAANPPKNLSELLAKLNDSATNISKNSPFPASIDNKEMGTQLIQVEKDTNVIFQYTLPTTTSTLTINTIPYPIKTYAISAGTAVKIQKVISLLKDLEELPYPTSYIDGLSLSPSDNLWTFSLSFEVILRNQ